MPLRPALKSPYPTDEEVVKRDHRGDREEASLVTCRQRAGSERRVVSDEKSRQPTFSTAPRRGTARFLSGADFHVHTCDRFRKSG